MTKKTIYLIGDSLIEFNDWQSSFLSCQVKNFGFAGESVAGLLARLPTILAHQQPDLLLIMIGTNNIVMEDYFFLPDYQEIIDQVRAAYPDCKIIVNSLLPMDLPWLADTAVARMNGQLAGLAQRSGATYLDAYNSFYQNGRINSDYFEADKIHLSPAGYSCWEEVIAELLD